MAGDDDDRTAKFQADFYEVPTLERAKTITVTSEQGMTGAERWVLETRFLVEDIGKFLPISPGLSPRRCPSPNPSCPYWL